MKRTHLSLLIGVLAGSLAASATAAPISDISTASKQDPKRARSKSAVVQYRPDQRAAQTSFDRFIVKYRDGSIVGRDRNSIEQSVNAAAAASGLTYSPNPSAKLTALTLKHVRKLAVGSELVRAPRPLNQAETNALLTKLRADPAVLYAQPDYFKFKQDLIPNDPRFSDLQWDLTDPAAGIGSPRAWDYSSGTGVVVAVLDTGYVDHRDLSANIVPGYDFISWYGQTEGATLYPDVAGDGNGRDADAHDPGDWLDGTESFCGSTVSDSTWHGTHVAGTIAAVANNAVGIAGVAYGAKVQPVRVLGHCGGLTSDIADGIVWASGGTVAGVPANPSPAEVLNLSLGGYGACSNDPVTQDAINGAIGRGATVVVAAGNSNMDAASFSPASCSGVITVGATGVDGAKSYFSNYGPAVALSAPGGNARYSTDGDTAWIWSTGNSGTTGPVASPSGDILIGQAGTSMAAPHVSAVIAQMQSASVGAGHGVLAPSLVKSLLKAATKPFVIQPAAGTPIGTGILDAAASVAAAAAGVHEEDLAVPLSNRAPTSGQAGAPGDALYYRLQIPAGVRSLSLRTYGGTGDVSLFVGRGAVPTTTNFVAASVRPGNTEAVVLTNPVAGIYYLRLQMVAPTSGLTVLAAY